MESVYTFNETVRGHLHVLNEFPCEDSSASFSAEDGKYHIAIVADGHGSKSCFRSDIGSKAATEAALINLKQFAEAALASCEIEERFYKDIFSNPRYRQMTIRRLTDTILADWHDSVLADYNDNPPSIEEIGESASEYADGKNISHIYGTTLIAALQLPRCLVLIHQGDGRCDVFYKDGSVDQPIPWDDRCEDNATTSLCDHDAAESFRSAIVDLSETPVAACFLGSDGVEDAYRDTYESLGGSHALMGGVHTFYKDLLCKLSENNTFDFEVYLSNLLPEFSANGLFSRGGSGDDVSVAGIVDTESIKSLHKRFTIEVKQYSLDEELFWKEDELRSKTRKHGILKKRISEDNATLESTKQQLRDIVAELNKKWEQKDRLAKKIAEAEKTLEEIRCESQTVVDKLDAPFLNLRLAIQTLFDEASRTYAKQERIVNGHQEELKKIDAEINRLDDERKRLKERVEELSNKVAEDQKAFDEYDEKYRQIESEIESLKAEIHALNAEGLES